MCGKTEAERKKVVSVCENFNRVNVFLIEAEKMQKTPKIGKQKRPRSAKVEVEPIGVAARRNVAMIKEIDKRNLAKLSRYVAFIVDHLRTNNFDMMRREAKVLCFFSNAFLKLNMHAIDVSLLVPSIRMVASVALQIYKLQKGLTEGVLFQTSEEVLAAIKRFASMMKTFTKFAEVLQAEIVELIES